MKSLKPLAKAQLPLWRSVGGIMECTRGAWHAWCVMLPVEMKHQTKYRVCLGPCHPDVARAYDETLIHGVALTEVHRARTVKVLPTVEGWVTKDTNDLREALPDGTAEAAADALSLAEALEVDDPADLVNATGGSA